MIYLLYFISGQLHTDRTIFDTHTHEQNSFCVILNSIQKNIPHYVQFLILQCRCKQQSFLRICIFARESSEKTQDTKDGSSIYTSSYIISITLQQCKCFRRQNKSMGQRKIFETSFGDAQFCLDFNDTHSCEQQEIYILFRKGRKNV